MHTRRKRGAPAAALLGVSLTLALSLTAAAGTTHQTVPVGWHMQSGNAGAVADEAIATLVRRADGVSFRFQTQHLRPGHAYTVWFVVVNNPAACSALPCPPPDVLLNPATDSQVTYAAGHVVGANGVATFAGAFQAGPLAGWLPDGNLSDPLTAEIHLVLNDHGPAIAEYLPSMIQSYRGGCSNASPFPPIFPPSALADGEVGPNTCLLYQAAIFVAP